MDNKFTYIAIFLIITIILLLFSPCLEYFFYNYDDWTILTAGYDIFNNNNFSLSFAIKRVAKVMTSPVRVFPWISWLIDYKLWGVNATVFYINSLLIYILPPIVLFLFLKRFFGNTLLAFLIAFVFAIHPINSLMATCMNRPASMCLLFYLISILMFFMFLTRSKLVYYFISILSAIFSFLCKEFAISLPATIILIDSFYLWDIFLLTRHKFILSWKQTTKDFLKRTILYIPYFLISLIFLKLLFSLKKGNSYWFHNFPHFNYLFLIYHMIASLLFVFRKYVISPKSICRYIGFVEPTTIYSIIGDTFFAILFLIALYRIYIHRTLRFRILLFGILWTIINLIPLLGYYTDLRVAFIGMRHYYIISIGFTCILMWLALDNNLLELKTKKIEKKQILSIVILCILLINFSFRTLEFKMLVKNLTFKAKTFYLGLKELLPKYPPGSNLYFLDNNFDEPTGIFLFYGYPKKMKEINYYYVFSGTDIVLEKDYSPSRKRHQWKRSNFKFALSSLDLGKSNFVITWNVKEKKLEDSSGLIKKLIMQPKTDTIFPFPKWDFSNAHDTYRWSVGNGAQIDYNEKSALKINLGGYKEYRPNYHSQPQIFSPKFNIPANAVKKIKINMRLFLDIPIEEKLIKGDPDRSFKEYLYDVFFLLDDPIIGLHWISNKDPMYDETRLILLPVKADGLLHEYEILPQNSLAWLESEDVIQIVIHLSQFPGEIQIKSIEFIPQ